MRITRTRFVAVTTLLLHFAAANLLPAESLPNEKQSERIAAAYLLALGRKPTRTDVAPWTQQAQDELTISAALTHLRAQLEGDNATRHTVIIKACYDAFGRAPTDDESRAWAAAMPVSTYTELMQRHVQSLRDNSAEYERVIQRVYPFVIGREAYTEEVDYWKKHGVLPYCLLVACVENWARRNQPGLMVTSGTPTVSVNSEFLLTVRLSPAVAAEARAATGLDAGSDAWTVSALAHTLVTPGGEHVISAGRIHFVAAGAEAPSP
jgi:hypothetical protein